MTVFTLTAVPLVYLLVTSLFFTEFLGEKNGWKYFYFGLLLAVPVFIVFFVIKTPLPSIFTWMGLLLFSLWNDNLLLVIFPVALFLLALYFHRDYKNSAGERETTHNALSFVSGFYTVYAVTDVLFSVEIKNSYLLFILPALRISTVLIFAVCMNKYYQEAGLMRYLYLLVLTGFQLFYAITIMLYRQTHYIMMLLLTIVILSVSFVLFLLLSGVTYRFTFRYKR